ncbi:uncharacterized protein B0P05DRAFT_634791 [Gilbertella persicaria]|uniref:uncharacterized protein n=1 Tax=Gilbertella persicaria TaxID=101096 RepID=UPI0022206387|nr:uncharacterized protein B0P05DRAFT_634791 [Gilbertella persicaria]KAI8091115.1 hypothetical protein B0P05DRAFT_634791 [Gilbertella persicaria]
MEAHALSLWKSNVLFTIGDRHQNKLFYQVTIKSVVQVNAFTEQPLQLYIEEFQSPYLVHTKRHYEVEAARKIAASSISHFMQKANERLQQENMRTNHYCHSTSHSRIVKSLLRHSRIASYDRALPQVYTTPKQHKKIGDWGLKRNLPTVIRTNHVTIGALDTAEHQTPWESGAGKVLFIKRWKENFPNSRKPQPRSEEIQYNAANMTPAEFQRLLREAAKKGPEFQTALAKKQVVPEQVFDYLHVNFSETTTPHGGGVVGPTYSDYHIGWDYPVQGRILNRSRMDGHAAGIGGVVAMLRKRDAIGLKGAYDRGTRIFYVNKAEMDEQGKPRVEVTVKSKEANAVPILNDHFDDYHFRFGNQDMTVAEMMNSSTKPRRVQANTDTDDNVKPNPDHTNLMSRISQLLNDKKDTA